MLELQVRQSELADIWDIMRIEANQQRLVAPFRQPDYEDERPDIFEEHDSLDDDDWHAMATRIVRTQTDPSDWLHQVAVAGNREFVGFVDGRRNFGSHDRLAGLFVHPAVQGRGIGRLLLERFLEWGCQSEARVDVRAGDAQTTGFYKHFGFRTVADSERIRQGLPVVTMSLGRGRV